MFSFKQIDKSQIKWVNQFYKLTYPKGKANKNDIIWVCLKEDQIVAALRYKLLNDAYLLTGLAVAPHRQGQGLASQLFHHSKVNAKPIYCLCQSELSPFYQKLGFSHNDDAEIVKQLASSLAQKVSSGKLLLLKLTSA